MVIAALHKPRQRYQNSKPLVLVAAATFISVFGSSMFASVRVFYLIDYKGLAPQQTGVITGLSSAIAVLGAVPFAALVLRMQPALIKTSLLAAMSLTTLAYFVADSFATLLLVAGAIAFLDRGVASVHGGLVATIAHTTSERALAKAYVRTALSSAVALGGLGAVVPLGIGGSDLYNGVLVLQAVCFAVSALMYRQVVSRAAGESIKTGDKRTVWRDRRFAVFALATGLVTMHYPLLTIGIPLWIVHLGLPAKWLVGVLVGLKAVGVVLGQVRASRAIDSVERGRWALLGAAAILVVVCAVLTLSGYVRTGAAIAMIIVVGMLLTVGDLLLAAGQFYLSFALAPEAKQVQYQSFMTIGPSIAAALAPVLLAWAPLQLGPPGWLLVAAAFVLFTVIADTALAANPTKERPDARA